VRARSLHLELAHVRDVEHACVRPDAPVLGNDPPVLHRHLPASEGDETRAGSGVTVVERRSPEGLHRPRMLEERYEPAPASVFGLRPSLLIDEVRFHRDSDARYLGGDKRPKIKLESNAESRRNGSIWVRTPPSRDVSA